MRRSKRIETLDQRPVNLDGYINEWPEMGKDINMKIENGEVCESSKRQNCGTGWEKERGL